MGPTIGGESSVSGVMQREFAAASGSAPTFTANHPVGERHRQQHCVCVRRTWCSTQTSCDRKVRRSVFKQQKEADRMPGADER